MRHLLTDADHDTALVKILLVKLSSLGDVVHALPVVQDIHVALQGAQVDWVVEKSFAPLLAMCPGVHRVIPCEIRRWRQSFWTSATRAEWRHFRHDLKRTRYDAVIDLQGLTKSALVARVAALAPAGRRYALANQTEGSGYEAPTRWVADVAIDMTPHIHAVQRSRELAARALGYTLQGAAHFGLKPIRTALITADASRPTVVLVHGTSRADKEWPLAHWVQLAERLIADGFAVALAHGNPRELATSEAIRDGIHAGVHRGMAQVPVMVWPLLALDALSAQLARSSGVIGVDSGVSHIAVALDLPHVQIYNFDTAWRTGPGEAVGSGRQLSVYAQPVPTVDSAWQAWQTCRAVQGGKASA